MTQDWRLVIAFAEPPATWHFDRAKSGKCWTRKIQGRQWAVKLGQELAALSIHGTIKKIDPPKPSRKRGQKRASEVREWQAETSKKRYALAPASPALQTEMDRLFAEHIENFIADIQHHRASRPPAGAATRKSPRNRAQAVIAGRHD